MELVNLSEKKDILLVEKQEQVELTYKVLGTQKIGLILLLLALLKMI